MEGDENVKGIIHETEKKGGGYEESINKSYWQRKKVDTKTTVSTVS